MIAQSRKACALAERLVVRMGENIFLSLDKIGARSKIALERFSNDEELFMKHIRKFPDEPSMGRLRKAVAEKDYAEAEKAVHALKGIVKNLDFTPLADATVDMLEELRDGNIEEALKAYDDIEKKYAQFCNVINNWKAEQ